MASPAVIKQLTVVILALIGLADAHWGLELLGHVTTELVTIIITLLLAGFGLAEMRSHAAVEKPRAPSV